MPGWDHFADVIGDAAGALVGLLFVAISINVQKIMRSEGVRHRAGQTLVDFAIVLLTAILLAIPSQSRRALGAEFLALALLAGVTLEILERRAKSAEPGPLGWLLKRINANIVIAGGLALTGALLLAGINWAPFVLVPTTCFALISGIASAWFLLTRLAN
jgi:hypothetical protein